MTQLAAQSILALCNPVNSCRKPMIDPFVDHKVIQNGKSYGLSAASYDARIAHHLLLRPGEAALAYTVEDFFMPYNVVAYVVDKSTWARKFMSAMNTLIDPGFEGNLTLELVNLGPNIISIQAGDPICQIAFHWLDQHTDRPYDGIYQHQTKAAHPARDE